MVALFPRPKSKSFEVDILRTSPLSEWTWPRLLVQVLDPGSWPRFWVRVPGCLSMLLAQFVDSFYWQMQQVLGLVSWLKLMVQVVGQAFDQVFGPGY